MKFFCVFFLIGLLAFQVNPAPQATLLTNPGIPQPIPIPNFPPPLSSISSQSPSVPSIPPQSPPINPEWPHINPSQGAEAVSDIYPSAPQDANNSPLEVNLPQIVADDRPQAFSNNYRPPPYSPPSYHQPTTRPFNPTGSTYKPTIPPTQGRPIIQRPHVPPQPVHQGHTNPPHHHQQPHPGQNPDPNHKIYRRIEEKGKYYTYYEYQTPTIKQAENITIVACKSDNKKPCNRIVGYSEYVSPENLLIRTDFVSDENGLVQTTKTTNLNE